VLLALDRRGSARLGAHLPHRPQGNAETASMVWMRAQRFSFFVSGGGGVPEDPGIVGRHVDLATPWAPGHVEDPAVAVTLPLMTQSEASGSAIAQRLAELPGGHRLPLPDTEVFGLAQVPPSLRPRVCAASGASMPPQAGCGLPMATASPSTTRGCPRARPPDRLGAGPGAPLNPDPTASAPSPRVVDDNLRSPKG